MVGSLSKSVPSPEMRPRSSPRGHLGEQRRQHLLSEEEPHNPDGAARHSSIENLTPGVVQQVNPEGNNTHTHTRIFSLTVLHHYKSDIVGSTTKIHFFNITLHTGIESPQRPSTICPLFLTCCRTLTRPSLTRRWTVCVSTAAPHTGRCSFDAF